VSGDRLLSRHAALLPVLPADLQAVSLAYVAARLGVSLSTARRRVAWLSARHGFPAPLPAPGLRSPRWLRVGVDGWFARQAPRDALLAAQGAALHGWSATLAARAAQLAPSHPWPVGAPAGGGPDADQAVSAACPKTPPAAGARTTPPGAGGTLPRRQR
jgi:predicted DNA-binding transcriptional regulator AlpA